jgi:hypothetical protein
MNKRIALISILLIGVLASCNVIPQFQQAREQYVETRTAELLAEIPTNEPAATTEVVEIPEVTATLEPTKEATEEVTEEVTKEATATEEVTATEEATTEATEEAGAQSKAMTSSNDPKVYLGKSSWEDNMTAVGNWNLVTDEYLSATYDNNTLLIQTLTKQQGWRIAQTDALTDAYIEANITASECTGADNYGLIFRVPANVGYNQGYIFAVSCDGKYSLRNWDRMSGASGTTTWLVQPTESDAIKAGEGQTNRLGIMAVGDRLIMYINGQKVGEAKDSTYASGNFGVYLKAERSGDLKINVTDVQYWLNPTVK